MRLMNVVEEEMNECEEKEMLIEAHGETESNAKK